MNPANLAVPPASALPSASPPQLDVPTVLTLGEPSAREIGTLVTVLLRAAGVGAAFASRADDMRDLMQDHEVGALVFKLSADAIASYELPVTRADVVVMASIPTPDVDALLVAAHTVGPLGRLVLKADVPGLVSFARLLNTPVIWYSAHPENSAVLDGVAAWGDGATIVDGHLMVAHDGAWCDAGRVAKLPPHTPPQVALAAALAAMCAGVPLSKVVAALPA